MKIETILIPTDFSEDAEAALALAKELGLRFGAKLQVLHVLSLTPYVAEPWTAASMAEAIVEIRHGLEDRMASLCGALSVEGLKVEGKVEEGPASLAIVEAAERLHSDVIVMGTRGRTGLSHVLLGSVAERVVRHAPCPVLTTKAKAKAK